MHHPVTRATIARDPQRTVRPWSHPDPACLERSREDQHPAITHWQSLLDRGLLGNNPPSPPEVVAQRDANDALFRRLARPRAQGDTA